MFFHRTKIKLEISNKISRKSQMIWKLNNLLLNNPLNKDEITIKIRKYFESNSNENTTQQNLWDADIMILGWKFDELSIHPNKLGKEEKVQRRN